MEPTALCKAIYPTLLSFADANSIKERALYLSRAAMQASNSPIFVMDTLTGLYCYYVDEKTDVPFPPPQDCGLVFMRFALNIRVSIRAGELRKFVKRTKGKAPLITPRVVFARPNTGNARFFEANLLEEADSMGFNFATFMEAVIADCVAELNA